MSDPKNQGFFPAPFTLLPVFPLLCLGCALGRRCMEQAR